MRAEDIRKLIKRGESDSLEFKSHFSNAAIDAITAFSNTSGGTVFLGVGDGGAAAGLSWTNETAQQWLNEIKTKTSPAVMPDIEAVQVDGKTIAVIRVKEYPIKPVAVNSTVPHLG
jgi:ATP-dependent DNA helicase RecG